MVVLPYSGYTSRLPARFHSRPSPPGAMPDHFNPNAHAEPDPFNPQPTPPPNQRGDVWVNDDATEESTQRALAMQPITHWYNGQPAVPSGVPYPRAQQAMQERMMADHSVSNYVPDGIRLYQHATDGQANHFTIGREPVNAGVSLPEGAQYLANGKNSYDQTNGETAVYSGDPANVGRYRLGVKTEIYGLYAYPLGRFGQDALLHAYTGLVAQFPAQKRQMNEYAAPYTPSSSGAGAYWQPASSYQAPSFFALPSETSLTDYATTTDGPAPGDEFSNGGRL